MFHNVGESIVKIGLMTQIDTLNMAMEGFAFDKIEHANEVALFILDGISMHEIIVAGDQIQDTSLFFGTAKTLELDVSDMGRKLFIKDEFNDLQASVFKVNGALHPKFDLVINSKPPFFGIMTNEIGFAAKNHYITILDPKEICGVRMNLKMMGALGGRKPSGCHLLEVFLR
jgi:ATP-dependent phosphoenolpyruvate carboxykinase